MNAERPTFLGLGEALWDLLPEGRKLGGAPANFAYHAHALGADARPITRIGRDALGREILAKLQALGLPTDCVQIDDTAPTGTVSVEMLPGGDHRFEIHEDVAWDHIEADPAALAAAAHARVLCFGTLAQRSERSRTAIQTLLKAAPNDALRIFDVNLRQQFYSRAVIERSLTLANMVKLNDGELHVLADLLGLKGDASAQVAEIAHRYHLNLVALTRGDQGSLLYAGGRSSEEAGAQVYVNDTIGAGDSFTAAMALGWLAGWSLDRIHRSAIAVASYVCTQSGATPPLPESLTALFAVHSS